MKVKHLVVLLMCMMFIAFGLVACSRGRSDAEITSDVEAKIHADATLATAPITIQSNNGVVVLSGSVDTVPHAALLKVLQSKSKGSKA